MARVLGFEPRVCWFWRPVVYQLTETRKIGSQRGTRTLTDLRPTDFKSVVYTISPPGHYLRLLSILYVIKSATTLIKMLPINPTRTPNKKCIITMG